MKFNIKRFLMCVFLLCAAVFYIYPQIETKEYSDIKECEDGKETIVIKSNVRNAVVTLNGEYQGRTTLVIENLFPNYYNIIVSKSGYVSEENLVEVKKGYTIEYYFDLKKE